MHRRRRLAPGFTLGVLALAVAIIADGLLSTMFWLIAVLLVADALVPDSHTPLFRELPESKRRRLRGR